MMISLNFTFLMIFFIIAYMMIIDQNVAKFIVISCKIVQINIERFIWMLKYHPNNFITTWIQNRKYDEIVKKMQKEYENEKSL